MKPKNDINRQKEISPSDEINDCQFLVGDIRIRKKSALCGENGVECARKLDIFGKCVDHRKNTKFRKISKVSSICIVYEFIGKKQSQTSSIRNLK